jgi:hypothetical protein
VDGGGKETVLFVEPAQLGDDVAIEGITVSGGHSTDDIPGGIAHGVGDLTLTGVEVSGNAALDSDGGGIASFSDADSLTIIDSTVTGNTAAEGDGGGVAVSTGDVDVLSSTLSGNTAGGDGHGGGLYFDGNSASIDDSTIAGNTAGYGGGIYGVPSASDPYLRNTILADNSATEGDDDDLGGPAYAGFTLFETPPGAVFETVDDSNIEGADPRLQPLALNGGTTRTHALSPTSPAIDKGLAEDSPDQRGIARPLDFASIPNSIGTGANGSDIGAFELDVEPPPPGGGGGTVTPVQPGNTGQPNTKAKRKCKKRKKKRGKAAAIARKCKPKRKKKK